MNTEKQEFARNIIKHISRLERQRRYFLDKHLGAYKLHGSMFLIISFLDRNPGASQDRLCEYLLIDKSGIARKCKKLQGLGYIRREQSRDDRRQNNLFLTEKGKELIPVIRSLLAEWRGIVTKNMDENEQKMLIELLSLMEKNALEYNQGEIL
ncbi:MAG TPA: MarR family transcriptional regulator [Clostridiaceae bacterium]|nr:MarR family transcriptional regulator [Clostridiaceae bacterium]